MPTVVPGAIPAMPRHIQFFQESHGKNYVSNTLLIDMTQVIRGLGLLIYYRTTHKKKNLDCAITLIHNQLKEFETWLLQEEQNALIAIKNAFNIHDTIWNSCLTDIKELKAIYTKAMCQPSKKTVHNKDVPTQLLDTITTLLLKNNINPQSISIQMADDQKTSRLMCVLSTIKMIINPADNKLIISKKYLPSTLEIFPGMMKNTKNIVALCAHEVQHIIENHVPTRAIVQTYLKHYCAATDETLGASPEFQKFIQIQEAQAELLSAIKDPEIAHCLSTLRSKAYYPNYLYEDHYYHLSSVDMLWKLDSWLTRCKQFSIAHTKHDILTKMRNLADSFKELIAAPH